MHLVLNASDLGRRRGGNESYLWGLLRGLAAVAEPEKVRISLIVAGAGSHAVAADPALGALEVLDVGAFRRLPFLLWQQTALLHRARPDWYVSTFFLPPLTPSRAVVLVHDLSFRAHPDYFPRPISIYMRLLTGWAIRRADVVVALSEFTRRETVHYYPAAEGKAAVLYPGVGEEFTPDGDPAADDAVLSVLGVRRPYLLAVGNIHPRKNLSRLLAAWQQLRAADQPLPAMVWVGLDRWGSGELLARARAAGVQIVGFVPAECLPSLYRRAEALAYPSLYEGFGLPPLEAMACGTPALSANSTSLPEAVGEAAVTVDPTDIEAMAGGLARLLFDQPLRRQLVEKGLAQAASFRWERTARRLLETLQAAHHQG